MAEIWGAAIAVGGTLLSGYMQQQGAKKAGDASAAGSAQAIAEQRRQFDLTRSDTAPYRSIGAGALGLLGAPYGLSTNNAPSNQFGPGGEAMAGAAPVNGFAPVPYEAPNTPLGKYNYGAQITSKLGTVGKILDPAAAIFGSSHGDENRNLKAFASESGVMQLPDGRLALPDGTIFNQDQLKDVAGTWYGAVHAPDGDQAGWQKKFADLTGGLKTANGGGGGNTIDMTQDASGQWVPTPGGGVRQQLTAGPSTAPGSTPAAPGAGGTPDYSNFFASPDFKFRQQQGDQAITRNAAALGGLASGNTGTALTEYSSNLAAGEYGNYFNRLASLAGIGQSAVNTSTQAGLTTASNIGNAAQNGADARASGIAAGADAWGNAAGTIGGIGYNYFNQPKRIGTGGYGTQAVNYRIGSPVGSYA
ncbi:MAG: hypothetical protein ACREB0_00115 [Sphingopyxis sp.]